ncbi:MAG: S41 family peptidase [Pseudomonadaceae bacterium]|nr:S41 family peptidase [Pseudomonadaceae bacterium]
MLFKVVLLVSVSLALSACGGGGGGGGGNGGGTPPPPPPSAQTDFERGIFSDPDLFANICLNPRNSGGFNDTQGNAFDENEWLRAWSHDLYLWYDEIVDIDPQTFDDPLDYFDLMQTNELTPSGARKDQFHFTFDTEAWQALSQSGVSAGYGAEFILIRATPPREIVVAFVEPSSPADQAGITRGSRILLVDGVDAVNDNTQAGVDVLNEGLFPSSTGNSTRLRISDFDESNVRDVDLVSASITQNPTPVTDVFQTSSGPVGYLLFTTHIAPAEAALVAAIEDFETAGVTDLILDLRYNGGGFLDIANQLSYMVAGPSAASGRTFDETQFNDKYPTINPVTGQALAPTAFHEVTQGFSLAAGNPLPSINLNRVFILSSADTCSASEAIINGLRGINVEVILIGETTCGKPYGFYPTDNCGTTYFTIQFRGVNALGFGDYADGFIPSENPVETVEVRGCEVADDYSRALGDPTEARLSTALDYIATGQCVVPVRTASSRTKALSLQPSGGIALQKRDRMPGMVIDR